MQTTRRVRPDSPAPRSMVQRNRSMMTCCQDRKVPEQFTGPHRPDDRFENDAAVCAYAFHRFFLFVEETPFAVRTEVGMPNIPISNKALVSVVTICDISSTAADWQPSAGCARNSVRCTLASDI